MYRIRFNLGRGKNYKKWKILNTSTKGVVYLNPDEVSLILNNATLCNRKKDAKRINEGHTKYVCSWIECESYISFNFKLHCLINTELQYNPRVAPFWRDFNGNDIDGHNFEQIATTGNKVFRTC